MLSVSLSLELNPSMLFSFFEIFVLAKVDILNDPARRPIPRARSTWVCFLRFQGVWGRFSTNARIGYRDPIPNPENG